MKHILISLLIFLYTEKSMSQLYDQNWIVSDSAQIFKFIDDSIIYESIPKRIDTYGFWASISDENGNFEFFTNGFRAYSGSGDQLQNGYDLTDTAVEAYLHTGWGNHTGGVIIPRGNHKYYFINHSISDTYWHTGSAHYPDRLYFSEIDMNANGGAGAVTSKRNVLYDQPMTNTHITACRHGNGRDWWLVVNNYLDSTYVKFIVSPDTITGPSFQAVGAPYPGPDKAGSIIFSPDGSKMAGSTELGKLVIMDFDRCSGSFSNALSFDLPDDTFMYSPGSPRIVHSGGISLMFSASGRFLYVSRQDDLLQYDMLSTDIRASWKVIYHIEPTHFGALDAGYLTPNGTILLENINATLNGFNIILSPDSADTLCHFIKEYPKLGVWNDVFINQTFNYRLGKKAGSSCDTLSGIEQVGANSIQTKLYPNPASEMVQLDLYTRDLGEPLSFVVYDMIGQEILRQNIPLYRIQVARNNVSSGVYNWQIQNVKGQVKATGKLVWE